MLNAYKDMTDDANPGFQKSTIDAARCVLPNATPTVIYVTMNIRALMNFFNERLCARASKEIREVAKAMVAAILNADTISKERKKSSKQFSYQSARSFLFMLVLKEMDAAI